MTSDGKVTSEWVGKNRAGPIFTGEGKDTVYLTKKGGCSGKLLLYGNRTMVEKDWRRGDRERQSLP